MITLLWMILCFTTASAQVKTYKNVVGNDTLTVNASDCVDCLHKNYLLWGCYDYKNKKAYKMDAKREGVSGSPMRSEMLYKMDNPLLTYSIGKYQATLSKWCTNSCQPGIEQLFKIAEVLNVDVKDLLWST